MNAKLFVMLLACVITLAACASKKAVIVSEEKDEAPEIRCELGPTDRIGKGCPRSEWLNCGTELLARVLQILRDERAKRAEEHRCLQQHRDKGHIR